MFQFPKQKLVFGPSQVVARINQDQEISPQITLWNQQGSEVIQGTLLVIPIEEALLYIRPLYLRASGGRIPQLTRVVVAYQNQIVMEETLDPRPGPAVPACAFRAAIGPSPVCLLTDAAAGVGADAATAALEVAAAESATSALTTLADEAQDHYARAIDAQRDGNWALYGAEIAQPRRDPRGAAGERELRGRMMARSRWTNRTDRVRWH